MDRKRQAQSERAIGYNRAQILIPQIVRFPTCVRDRFTRDARHAPAAFPTPRHDIIRRLRSWYWRSVAIHGAVRIVEQDGILQE